MQFDAIDGNVIDSVEQDPLDHSTAGAQSARGGLLRGGAYGLGTVLSLVGIIFVTRALGPAQFGSFQTVFNLVALMAAFTEAGMGAVGIREFAQLSEPRARERFVRTLLGLRLFLAAVGVCLAIVVSIARDYDIWLVGGTVAAGLALLVGVAQSTVVIPLYGQLRFGFISFLEVARAGLLMVAYVTLALVAAGAFGFLAATLPVQIVLMVIVVYVTRGVRLAVPLYARDEWVALIKSNYALAMAAAIGVVYLYATQLATSFFATPLEVGYFAAALRVYAVAVVVPATIIFGSFAILARYAHHDRARFGSAVRSLSDGAFVISAALAVALFAGAPTVIRIVGGSEFLPAVSTLRILAPSLAAAGFVAVWGISLVSLHRHRAIVVANSVALGLSVGLGALLSWSFGANGAAIATVVGEVVLMLLFGIALLRFDATLRASLWNAIKIVLATLAVGGLSYFVPIPNIVMAIIAPLLFIGTLIVIRALPEGLLDIVPLPRLLARRTQRER